MSQRILATPNVTHDNYDTFFEKETARESNLDYSYEVAIEEQAVGATNTTDSK